MEKNMVKSPKKNVTAIKKHVKSLNNQMDLEKFLFLQKDK